MNWLSWLRMRRTRHILPAVGQTWADATGFTFRIAAWNSETRTFRLTASTEATILTAEGFEKLRAKNHLRLVGRE